MDCYIALGTNLGDLADNLESALAGLAGAGLEPLSVSSVWETEPVDTPDPRWFWNMTVRVEADYEPHELLQRLLEIERAAGRLRNGRNAPRTLDLDLLLVGDVELDEPDLRLPHPRMWSRRFVLEPLAEIAPLLRNPRTGRSVDEECRRLADEAEVRCLGRLASCGTRHL